MWRECNKKSSNRSTHSSVQSLSRVQLFVIPWIAARQASLSITNSRSLLKLMFIESVMPCISCQLILCCPLLLLSSIFPTSEFFPMSQFFASGGQSIGASASVLPMNIQDWFLLGWTGLISLQSKGLSRVFSNTTVQKRHKGGVISEVIDISPGNLNSSLSFIKPAFCMMYSAYKLKKQGDNTQTFPIWNQSVVSFWVQTLTS